MEEPGIHVALGDSNIYSKSGKRVRNPEKFYRKETEWMVQEITNPFDHWDGSGLHSLLSVLDVEGQGSLPFPHATAPLDDAQIQFSSKTDTSSKPESLPKSESSSKQTQFSSQ